MGILSLEEKKKKFGKWPEQFQASSVCRVNEVHLALVRPPGPDPAHTHTRSFILLDPCLSLSPIRIRQGQGKSRGGGKVQETIKEHQCSTSTAENASVSQTFSLVKSLTPATALRGKRKSNTVVCQKFRRHLLHERLLPELLR